MKKLIVCIATFMLAISLVACGEASIKTKPVTDLGVTYNIPVDWIDNQKSETEHNFLSKNDNSIIVTAYPDSSQSISDDGILDKLLTDVKGTSKQEMIMQPQRIQLKNVNAVAVEVKDVQGGKVLYWKHYIIDYKNGIMSFDYLSIDETKSEQDEEAFQSLLDSIVVQ